MPGPHVCNLRDPFQAADPAGQCEELAAFPHFLVGMRPFVSRVLDQRQSSPRHEARGAHQGPGPGDLADLDHATRDVPFDPPPGAGRDDLVRARAVAGVDDDLDPIAFHDGFL